MCDSIPPTTTTPRLFLTTEHTQGSPGSFSFCAIIAHKTLKVLSEFLSPRWVFFLPLLQTPQDEPGIHFQPFGCFPSNQHSVSIPGTLQKAVLPVSSQPNLLGRGREGHHGGAGPPVGFLRPGFLIKVTQRQNPPVSWAASTGLGDSAWCVWCPRRRTECPRQGLCAHPSVTS